MHSSRMRTGRSLTVCCSLLPGGGVDCLVWGGVCLIRGWGALVPGGSALFGGGSGPGGGVGLLWGGSAPGEGGGVSQHALRQTPSPPPWTEFFTHACENITLAQLRCGR